MCGAINTNMHTTPMCLLHSLGFRHCILWLLGRDHLKSGKAWVQISHEVDAKCTKYRCLGVWHLPQISLLVAIYPACNMYTWPQAYQCGTPHQVALLVAICQYSLVEKAVFFNNCTSPHDVCALLKTKELRLPTYF